MSNSVLFDMRCVSKRFVKGKEEITIFDKLSMTINRGDFISIMGPSGSGKTTMLNMLGGLDRPTEGEILFDGKPFASLSESALAKWRADHVGFIFQFYNLMPMLSAEKNVELPLFLKKLSRHSRQRMVAAALELVGLKDRARHTPRELSGGQQQRVAIARAIVSNPDLLLCDEPTGDLDRKTAIEILEILKELNQDFGKTIVMVTHDAIAAKYASRQIVLDKGDFITMTADSPEIVVQEVCEEGVES